MQQRKHVSGVKNTKIVSTANHPRDFPSGSIAYPRD